jgi:hypothetical protein
MPSGSNTRGFRWSTTACPVTFWTIAKSLTATDDHEAVQRFELLLGLLYESAQTFSSRPLRSCGYMWLY